MPPTAQAVLEGLRPQGAEVAFAEQIWHPALTTPLTARGVFRLGQGGALIRDQQSPTLESARIGADFLTLTKAGEANLLPIPDDMAPMLAALRALVTGAPGTVERDFTISLAPAPDGWHLTFDPRRPGPLARLVATGCGAALARLDLDLADGTRRQIVLGAP